MTKSNFYLLVACFTLFLGGCDDDEPKKASITDPAIYNWIDDKKGEPVTPNPLAINDGWKLENSTISAGKLSLGPAYWSQAQRDIDLLSISGWQIELDFTPNVLAGSNEIQWESDKAGNYYQFVLYTDIGAYFINRKGTSAIFGPATESKVIEGYAKDKPFKLSIRKANDKLYIFIDEKFIVARPYEAGYGSGIDFLALDGSQATISNLTIIKTK